MASIEIPDNGLRTIAQYGCNNPVHDWGYTGIVMWGEIEIGRVNIGDVDYTEALDIVNEWAAEKLRKVFE